MRVEALSLGGNAHRLLVAGLAAITVFAAAPPAAHAQAPQAVLPDFTELVERVGPAVVNIRTLERGRARPVR